MNIDFSNLPAKDKIYYQDESVVIYCADCRDILPLFPDKSFDLVLTDPPYGIDYQSVWRIDWQRKEKIVGDKEFPKWVFDIKPRFASFIFCRWDSLKKIPTPKSFIVWDKLRHSMGDLKHEYGRQWEAIAFYPQDEHKFIFRPIDVLRVPCVPACNLTHPNEKPVDLLVAIIESNYGNLILDPFLGSGTTAVASKLLGRKCIGIEIEEKYCEIAKKRCSQSVMKLDIPKEDISTQRMI